MKCNKRDKIKTVRYYKDVKFCATKMDSCFNYWNSRAIAASYGVPLEEVEKDMKKQAAIKQRKKQSKGYNW